MSDVLTSNSLLSDLRRLASTRVFTSGTFKEARDCMLLAAGVIEGLEREGKIVGSIARNFIVEAERRRPAEPPSASAAYSDAFYEIAQLLGLTAMPISPKEAFEKIMLPRLRQLIGGPALTDDQQLAQDAADTANPAYFRGHDAGVHGAAERWKQALEDPIPAPGVMREPLESLYRRTEALRTEPAASCRHEGEPLSICGRHLECRHCEAVLSLPTDAPHPLTKAGFCFAGKIDDAYTLKLVFANDGDLQAAFAYFVDLPEFVRGAG